MNSSRYFQELCRKAVSFNLSADGPKDGRLYFTLNGSPICNVSFEGVCYHFPNNLDTAEKKEFCGLMAELAEETKIYVRALENAPPLNAADLREGYKLLCEHGNIVLAGKDMGAHGFQFVTWQYTYDRKGVSLGHYYHNDYYAAKEDFAVRSDLIDKHKLFEPEELKEIYRSLDQGLRYLPDLTYDQEQKMIELKDKLERIAPKVVEAYRAELTESQETVSDGFPEGKEQQKEFSEENQGALLSMQSI